MRVPANLAERQQSPGVILSCRKKAVRCDCPAAWEPARVTNLCDGNVRAVNPMRIDYGAAMALATIAGAAAQVQGPYSLAALALLLALLLRRV